MKYKWCKKFGHKWIYSLNSGSELRACRKCGCIEEYRRNVSAYGSAWFLLVMRTNKGANMLLESLRKDNA